MEDINNNIIEGEDPMEEITTLAKRILKVYGRVETPTLNKEIERMAKILDIPLEEVYYGK